MNRKHEYDAIVVGAGPNGLAAAIELQRNGLSVLVIEGSATIGGGMRSREIFPGYLSDICSAIHPMASGSPFFKSLSLKEFGLEFIHPEILASHPFDDGKSAVLARSITETANRLGKDRDAYLDLMAPIVENWPAIAPDILGPFKIPSKPFKALKFGLSALQSAEKIAKRFQMPKAKGLFAGMAAHSFLPLDTLTTAAVGLVLMANGHIEGWPIPKGGSQSIADAMAAYFYSLGGKIEVNQTVRSLDELPGSRAVLFDLGPKQLMEIAGGALPEGYKNRLAKYRYGPGVFKVDWILSGQVPFTDPDSRRAGTVHVGGALEEIALNEKQTFNGKHAEKPFVLLAQQSLFDSSRAPEGKQVLWGYCHVPHGSNQDMTAAIENQIERFAPGFKDLIIDKQTMTAQAFEAYNPNYIGGDINGGILDLNQLYSRPVLSLSPYKTPAKGIYLCSASTPPGGGVHGMCGYHAARRVLKDLV